MVRLGIGRVRLALQPSAGVAAWVERAWGAEAGEAELEVRSEERPDHHALRVRGAPVAIFRNTARGLALYSRPFAERGGLRWVEGRPERLRAGDRSLARLWTRSLHLDREAYPAESTLDFAVALAMAMQPERPFLHGALVDTPAGALGLVGVSGAGKTTLAADLVAAGWTAGSDEAFGFDPQALDAWPIPRAPVHRTSGRLPFSPPDGDLRRELGQPTRWAAPRPLRGLLLLASFGPEAAILPLDTRDPALWTAMLDSVPIAASWGPSPARHALRAARLAAAFAQLRLGALRLGPREASVAAVRAWFQ